MENIITSTIDNLTKDEPLKSVTENILNTTLTQVQNIDLNAYNNIITNMKNVFDNFQLSCFKMILNSCIKNTHENPIIREDLQKSATILLLLLDTQDTNSSDFKRAFKLFYESLIRIKIRNLQKLIDNLDTTDVNIEDLIGNKFLFENI